VVSLNKTKSELCVCHRNHHKLCGTTLYHSSKTLITVDCKITTSGLAWQVHKNSLLLIATLANNYPQPDIPVESSRKVFHQYERPDIWLAELGKSYEILCDYR